MKIVTKRASNDVSSAMSKTTGTWGSGSVVVCESSYELSATAPVPCLADFCNSSSLMTPTPLGVCPKQVLPHITCLGQIVFITVVVK